MSSANHSSHDHHDGPSVSIYWFIFGCLAVLTFVTVAVAKFFHFPPVAAVILAFMIAISKASLVVTFFMHLKYDSKALRVLCVVPTLLTMVLMLALLPDVGKERQHIAGDPALQTVAANTEEPAAEGQPAAEEPAKEH